MRFQRSLAGLWQFQLDPEGTARVDQLAPDREISVPMPWQAAFPELESYSGYAWYRRTITLEESWLGGELLLSFGAVDYWCQVFVNGRLVGEHEGGYTPFTLPIRAYVQAGRNQIAVRVYDAVLTHISVERWPDAIVQQPTTEPPFDPRDVPHGKQEWYIGVGGIWQDVTLTATPSVWIDHVRVLPDIHSGSVALTVRLGGNAASLSGGTLRAVIEAEGAGAAVPLRAGTRDYSLSLSVAQPKLWSPAAPNLYTVSIRLDAGGLEDEQAARFGFREIATRDGQLLLNGEPLFLLSALDQDLYPETIYTVPSDAFLRDQFAKAKALGLNSLRCHIKVPDPRYLDLADEMGLLIWAEIPSWRTLFIKTEIHPNLTALGDEVKERVRHTLEAMIERDFNHPSLVIWSIVNEDWGTALPISGSDRAWVAQMYDLCKRLDPTRLVVDNSACFSLWGPNLHVKSDLDDFHFYAGIPDQANSFAAVVEQINLRPLWTYSSHGDAQRTGQEPLVLSEFGNWGLPSVRALSEAHGGAEPPWFSLGPWWSNWEGQPGWPRGVVARFERLGLNAMWPDYEAFAAATQWHQFQALKFELETMRRLPNIRGYVITEFTDAYWESNGLLDFNRCPKVYHERFTAINAEDVIVPQLYRYAYWDDQTVRVRLYASRYSATDWSGARLSWDLNGSGGQREIGPTARAAVADLGVQAWALPTVERAQNLSVQLAVHNAAGGALATNTVDLLALPAAMREASYQGSLAIITLGDLQQRLYADASPQEDQAGADLAGFAGALRRLGYHAQSQLSAETRIIVTDWPTAESLAWVRAGGDMLFLCGSTSASPFFWRQGRGGVYGGGWISSYNWLRPAVYRRTPTASPLMLPFQSIVPTGVIVGLPVEDSAVQPDFLAGQVTGWVQHPALHTVQFRYGRGRVIMTTYGLKEALAQDADNPLAIAMLHDLVDHLTSDACQPVLRANY